MFEITDLYVLLFRWMMEENKKISTKKKKQEYRRITTLTERCFKHDPRQHRQKIIDKDTKAREKKAKADAKKAAEQVQCM
jgi:hypothetical protein